MVQEAVEEISKLPGIGKKTALRLVLHLLKKDVITSVSLANAISNVREKIVYCTTCHNIADERECFICKSHRRDRSLLCIVEDTRDVLAIENTSQYLGLYHVLGGIISPMEGVGPETLNIESLITRLNADTSEVKEVIFALSPTMEGDTTAFYITKKLKALEIKISSIARGIPLGGELEYTDEMTLGRSIVTRTKYDQN